MVPPALAGRARPAAALWSRCTSGGKPRAPCVRRASSCGGTGSSTGPPRPPAAPAARPRRSAPGACGAVPTHHDPSCPTLFDAVLPVAGDGRCLFRSLAQGEAVAAAPEGSPRGEALLPLVQETARADALRAAVCDELEARRGEVEPFIEGDYAAYVAHMRRPATWGGEPELAVACHVLRQPIAVYMAQRGGLSRVSRYGEDYGGPPHPDIPLLFHGGGHYELLLRREPQPPQRASGL